MAQEHHKIHNLFCLDVRLKGKYPWYMKKFFRKNKISITCSKRRGRLLQKGTADFCGPSYYFSNCHQWTAGIGVLHGKPDGRSEESIFKTK